MHERTTGVALAIQCGGESRRMGGDKALLPFVDGTLLEWVRDQVTPLFRHVFVVARDAARYSYAGLPVVTDALEVRGSAVGVYTAVMASPEERVLCLACDMPFVPRDVLLDLATGCGGHDVFVPRHEPYFQPLCAVYRRSAAKAYLDFIRSGRRRIDAVYAQLDTGYLEVGDGRYGDPDEIFLNVNTPDDLEAARRLVLEATGRPAAADAAATARSEPGVRATGLPSDPGSAATSAASQRGPDGAPLPPPTLPRRAAGARDLAPRIRAFMERTPVPTVSFVGKKKSGKTTVLCGVIAELARRGRRVAVLKHDTHGFDVDIPGTDSYRLREAGAVVAGISSPEMYVLVHKPRTEPRLEELIARVGESVDLVITEGYKREDAPKVEVSRRERSTTRICDEDELIGVASDQLFPDLAVPQLSLDDHAGLADLVEARIIHEWPAQVSLGGKGSS